MKNSVILKSMLALSILAAGTVTSNITGSVDAFNKSQKAKISLKDYYSKTPLSTTAKIEQMDGNYWTVTFKVGQSQQERSARITTKAKGFSVGNTVNIFIVPENSNRSGEIESIGGISHDQPGHESFYINVKKSEGTARDGSSMVSNSSEDLFLFNKEVTLKELDFRIRKMLIDKYGLYGSHHKGKIVVKDRSNGIYTFELDKRLQNDRMDYILKSGQIKEATVTLEK